MAGRIQSRCAQAYGACCPLIGVFEIDKHFCVMVLAMRTKSRARPGPVAGSRALAKQLLKKVAVRPAIGAVETAAAEFESVAPVRGRLEVLPRLPVGAKLVVGGALFRVLQYRIGLSQFLETKFRIGCLADIWMIFARQLAVGAFDFILAGASLDASSVPLRIFLVIASIPPGVRAGCRAFPAASSCKFPFQNRCRPEAM